MANRIAMALAAHPDDIEFMMAGTLTLLRQEGFETHYMNLSSGSCGSLEHTADRLRQIRRKEAEAAAQTLGARFHPSLGEDLEIFYELPLLRQLAAIIRNVRPSILLVPSPQDYMEDHTNVSRLAVTAAFARGLKNFATDPATKPITTDLTVYHAMPHGLRDPLRRRIIPGSYVDIRSVMKRKRLALAQHKSQARWLDTSQKMDSYLESMEHFARELGQLSHSFTHAEGWRRRLHYGFCQEGADPLKDALGNKMMINAAYEAELDQPNNSFQGN